MGREFPYAVIFLCMIGGMVFVQFVGVPNYVFIQIGLLVLAPCAMLVVALRHGDKDIERAGGRFCKQCGYDIRASPDRCPECGAVSAVGLAERWTAGAIKAKRTALHIAIDQRSQWVEPDHLMQAVLWSSDDAVTSLVQSQGLNVETLRPALHVQRPNPFDTRDAGWSRPFSNALLDVIDQAVEEAKAVFDQEVGNDHLFIAIVAKASGEEARRCVAAGLNLPALRAQLAVSRAAIRSSPSA